MSNTPFHYGAVPELESGLPLQQQVFQQRSSGLGARSKLVAALLCIVASVVFVSVAWTPSESGASSAALSPQPELLSIKCWHVFFCPDTAADDDSAAEPAEEPAAKADAIPGPVEGKNAISDPVPDAVSHEPMDQTSGAETTEEQKPADTISPDPAAAPLPIVIPATTTHKEASAEPEPALPHHHKSKAAAPAAAAAADDDDKDEEDDAEETEATEDSP